MRDSIASGTGVETTTEAVQRAGLELFAKYGFDATTVEDIAEAAGISRRTFFRYFASKNDVPWADAGPVLEAMARWLADDADGLPLVEALATAMTRFNTIHTDGPRAHRQRMMLIHKTPVLQAHRALKSADVQAMIARFVAGRTGERVDALGPQMLGQVAVGATVAAYDVWLTDARSDLEGLIQRAFSLIELAPGFPDGARGEPERRRAGAGDPSRRRP